MPASKPQTPPARPAASSLAQALLGLFATLATVAAVLVWLMQGSVNEYWRQTYHQEPRWAAWSAWPAWQLGGQWQQDMTAKRQAWADRWRQFDAHAAQVFSQLWQSAPGASAAPSAAAPRQPISASTPEPAPVAPPGKRPAPAANPASLPASQAQPRPAAQRTASPEPAAGSMLESPPEPVSAATAPPVMAPTIMAAAPAGKPATWAQAGGTIALDKTDRVFFVGDSMMQGVAPHVRRILTKEYGIDSLDLSKQSTGLAYPGFFDWPKTVQNTFAQHPDIRLMVVFLGPNDPWAFAVEKGQPYAKFKSEAWETAYRARIRALLDTARTHQAAIIWLQVPAMKNQKLDSGMQYLNSLYAAEVQTAHGMLIDSNQVLGQTEGRFNAYADIDDKKVKIRIDDGVHFTVAGQKLLAQAILARIQPVAAPALQAQRDASNPETP
ncbi:DUF459 domain-containing protein [Castellaniella hirudinis]|uniref:SGNH/GDSL hydrolase family protein n=1 Tax=Castellaniella hirudinis TaxID=1144617 RepID=UPI0039C0D898